MATKPTLEIKVEEVLRSNTVQKAGKLLRSRSGTTMLAVVSFLESALPLPILTDPFLMAAILADRARAARLVVVATAASVFGGLCAYLMALFFFDSLIGLMSDGVVTEFNHMVNGNGSSTWMLTLVGAVTPIPYTIVAWVVAVLKGSLLVFIIASTVGRGFRYVVVGYSTYKFGPLAVSLAKRYLGVASVVLLVVAVIYFWLKM